MRAQESAGMGRSLDEPTTSVHGELRPPVAVAFRLLSLAEQPGWGGFSAPWRSAPVSD